MSESFQERDVLWFNAIRQIGYHFSKIGEVIAKYAEEAEKFTHLSPRSRSAHPSSFPGISHNEGHHTPSHDDHIWQESPHVAKNPRDKYRFPLEGAHDNPRRPRRDLRHSSMQPSHPIRPPHYPPEYLSALRHPPSDAEMPSHHDARSGEPIDHRDHPSRPSSHRQHYSTGQLRSKRRSPVTTSDLEEENILSPQVRSSLDGRPSAFKAKNKRIRINWTSSENDVFFDTIQKFDTEDESSVLKHIVAALKGSRSWVQCKGHFRNLQFVGRISQTRTSPKRWVVRDQASKNPKTPGGDGTVDGGDGSSGGGTSGGGGGSKRPSSGTGEKNGDESGHDDSNHDDVQNKGQGISQQQLSTFDEHGAVAPISADEEDDKREGSDQADREDNPSQEEADIDVDMQDSEMELGLSKGDDSVDNNLSNGRVLQKSAVVRDHGVEEDDNEGHDGNICDGSKVSIHVNAEQATTSSTVHDGDGEANVDMGKSFDVRDIAIATKKQTAPLATNSGVLPQVRTSSREKRRIVGARVDGVQPQVEGMMLRK